MPNHHRRWAPALLGLAVLFLSSCQLMSGVLTGKEGTTTNPAGETRTLADIVIDDFIASIQGSTFSRALDAAGNLSPTDIAKLKTTIRNKVASDGLGASKNIDKILPSVMEGISSGVKTLAAADSDTVVSAQLLSKAMKSTSESLSKNAATLSTTSVVLSDVLKVVVKKGAAELAAIAATDPESAGKALQAVVKDISFALKTNSVAISETVVLQTVVTASVQAAVESNHTGLVQAIFTGTAEATTNTTTVGDVVKDAVLKACDGQASAPSKEATATIILKQASAGLNATSLGDKRVNVENNDVLTKTTDALKTTGVEMAASAVDAIKAAAVEPDPVATLSATIDGSPYVENTELEHSTLGRAITLSLPSATTITKQLIGPNGEDVTGTTYTLTGSGAFRFILLVKNTTGVKSAFKTLVIRVKSLPSEVAPVAKVVVKEGTDAVTGPLAWTKNGHTLTFDTSETTKDTTIKILSDDPSAFPAKDAEGKYSVVQKNGTVNYSVIVRNIGGTKTDVETVTVTVNPEPNPVAALGVFNGSAAVTAPLPKKDFYDLILKAEGSTKDDVAYEVVASPSAQVIKTAEGVWSTKIYTNTTFTLTVRNLGGQNSATATKTVTIAPEVAPKAVLTIKKDGVAVTNLDFSATGYDLVLDPAGSTTENTLLTLNDGGNNTVLVKNVDAGTWTAKAVLKTTTFTLTVKNTEGLQSSTTTATVVIVDPAPNSDVSSDVKAGQASLKALDLNAAKTSFNLAITRNPSDNDARIWSALVDLSAVSVHPEVVDLMRNKIGVVDYPADMNTLLSTTWLNSKYYGTKKGVVEKGPGRGYYVRGRLEAGEAGKSYYYYGYDQNGNYLSSYYYGQGTPQKFVPDATGSVYVDYWSQSAYTSNSSYSYLTSNPSVLGYKLYTTDGTLYTLETPGYSYQTAVRGDLVDAPAGYASSYARVLASTGKMTYVYKKLFTPSATGATYATDWYEQYSESNNGSSYLKANPTVVGYDISWNLIDLTNPQLFPTIAPVAGFQAMGGAGTNGYTLSDWSRLLLANVLTRNASGFNVAVDQVLNGPLGTNLDSIISRLNSVDETYRTTIPADMILKFSRATVPEGTTISVGKPELLLMVANLKVERALVQYLASVDLNYPLHSSFVNAMMIEDVADANKNEIPDFMEAFFANTPGVYFSSVLTERRAESRIASKASFLSALGDIQKALGLYQSAVNSTSNYYRDTVAGILGTMDTTEYYAKAKTGLANAQTGLTKLTSAVTDNSSLVVPSTGSPNDLVGASFVWPDTATSDGTTKTINPGALWAENALDFRKWFIGDSTRGFQYMVYVSWGSNLPSFTPKELPADRSTMDAAYWGLKLDGTSYVSLYAGVGLAPNLSMYRKFYPATPADMGVAGIGMNWYVVSGAGSTYDPETGKSTYTYNVGSFKPSPANELALGWINKK